jgi:hypothetical protein
LRKVGATRRAARYRATRRVAPTIGFARLASGAFYETIILLTYYEIIKVLSKGKQATQKGKQPEKIDLGFHFQ